MADIFEKAAASHFVANRHTSARRCQGKCFAGDGR